jgi:hypothetical protein
VPRDAYTYANGITIGDGYSNSHGDVHAYADCYGYVYAYADCNCYTHGNTDSHTYLSTRCMAE